MRLLVAGTLVRLLCCLPTRCVSLLVASQPHAGGRSVAETLAGVVGPWTARQNLMVGDDEERLGEASNFECARNESLEERLLGELESRQGDSESSLSEVASLSGLNRTRCHFESQEGWSRTHAGKTYPVHAKGSCYRVLRHTDALALDPRVLARWIDETPSTIYAQHVAPTFHNLGTVAAILATSRAALVVLVRDPVAAATSLVNQDPAVTPCQVWQTAIALANWRDAWRRFADAIADKSRVRLFDYDDFFGGEHAAPRTPCPALYAALSHLQSGADGGPDYDANHTLQGLAADARTNECPVAMADFHLSAWTRRRRQRERRAATAQQAREA